MHTISGESKKKTKLKIQSNAKNRAKKVRECIVYNDIYAFIDEIIIQNTNRAGATEVSIWMNNDMMKISDNGRGCSKPEILFTMDFSGFGNGFGEGFTSVYMIADWFKVRTHNWEGSLNVKEVLDENKGDLDADITYFDEFHEGFEIELKGEQISYYFDDIINYIQQAASIVPTMQFWVNGELVEKKDIFDITPTSQYTNLFKNRKYEGRLSLSNEYSTSRIKVYFEHRFVTSLPFHGLSGSILLKPKAVNLRTPDRRSIIYDEKEQELQEQLTKDATTLLKGLVKTGNGEDIKLYSDYVNHYMSVEDYMSYLMIEDNILNQFEVREMNQQESISFDGETSSTTLSEPNEQSFANKQEAATLLAVAQVASNMVEDTSQANTLEKENDESTAYFKVEQDLEQTPSHEQKIDTKRLKEDKKITSYVSNNPNSNSFVKKHEMEKVSIKNIKSKKNVVWVEKENEEDFSSLISKYEYYGVFTFVSPHVLYDNALIHLGIPHISSLKSDAIKKSYKVTKIGAYKKKEERVMELLGFIEKTLDLGETFNIATIDCKMIVELRGTKIYQEKLAVKGYAQGSQILFNRKDLDFGNLSSLQLGKNSFSIHDVKFILANLDVIAHELAHVIYGTEDNTKNHFEKQILIQNQISQAVMLADTLS